MKICTITSFKLTIYRNK